MAIWQRSKFEIASEFTNITTFKKVKQTTVPEVPDLIPGFDKDSYVYFLLLLRFYMRVQKTIFVMKLLHTAMYVTKYMGMNV